MQPAAKLIARSPGWQPRVLHMCRHPSGLRTVSGQARQIGLQICIVDEGALARLSRSEIAPFQRVIQACSGATRCLDSTKDGYENWVGFLIGIRHCRYSVSAESRRLDQDVAMANRMIGEVPKIQDCEVSLNSLCSLR